MTKTVSNCTMSEANACDGQMSVPVGRLAFAFKSAVDVSFSSKLATVILDWHRGQNVILRNKRYPAM